MKTKPSKYQITAFWRHKVCNFITTCVMFVVPILIMCYVSPFAPSQSVFAKGGDYGMYATCADLIKKGEVPFRDFFDMKGPVWMYLWGFLAMIYSGNVFRGVFFVEIIFTILNTALIYRLWQNYPTLKTNIY